MNIKRCENNHFYDSDKYDSCPHCENKNMTTEKKENVEKTGARLKTFFSGKENINNKQEKIIDNSEDRTVALSADAIDIQSFVKEENSVTNMGINEDRSLKDKVKKNEEETLQEQIKKARNKSDFDEVTQGYYNTGNTEPVVGWLVCIQGENKGESYEIHTGNNFIGRSALMDIIILDDHKISREKHSIVVYDPNNKKFMLLPGESRGLCYLNQELVLSAVEINIYDKIQMGNSTLLFIALCGSKFNWDEIEE